MLPKAVLTQPRWAAPVAERAPSAQGEGRPLGGLRPAAGDHGKVRAAGLLDRPPAGQAIADDVAAGGEVALGQGRDLLLPEALDHRRQGLDRSARTATTRRPQPPRLALGGRLDRGDERRLARRPPAAPAAGALPAQIGVVDLDPARELGLVRCARLHRRHQLVLEQPGGRLPGAQPPCRGRTPGRASPGPISRGAADPFPPERRPSGGRGRAGTAPPGTVPRSRSAAGTPPRSAPSPSTAPPLIRSRREWPSPGSAIGGPQPTLRAHPLAPHHPKPARILARRG